MKKRMAIMLAGALLVFGGILGFQLFKAHLIEKALAARGTPTQTVSTVPARYATWQPRFAAVGTLRAARGADLAPQVAGVVSHIDFASGDRVERGAPLLQLDAAADVARLASLRAAADLAEKTLKRARERRDFHAVSQAAVDEAAANLKSARAQVAEQAALVDRKTIRAPFAGRLGIRQVDLGEYLAPGTKIVTLQALDPLFVDFTVPQSVLPDLAVGDAVTTTSNSAPDETFEGKIVAIEPKVSLATRNAQVRARIGDAQHRLLPGTFVNVEVAQGKPHRYLTLPQTAVTYNPYGSTVFIVEKNAGAEKAGAGKNAGGSEGGGGEQLVAEQKFVTTGPTRGDQVAIVEGLAPGDTVVSAGQIKLRSGTPVEVNNDIEPPNRPNPTVPDR